MSNATDIFLRLYLRPGSIMNKVDGSIVTNGSGSSVHRSWVTSLLFLSLSQMKVYASYNVFAIIENCNVVL